MKKPQTARFAAIALLFLVLAGSSAFGPRTYVHPRRPAQSTEQSASAGRSAPLNRTTPSVETTPKASQKSDENQAVALTHTVVESVARGVRALGEALAEAVMGLVTGLVQAILSLFTQRSMY